MGVRTNEPKVLKRVLERLPPGAKPARSRLVDQLYSLKIGGAARKGVRRYHLLYGDSQRLARSMDLDTVFEALAADLQLYVAVHARSKLFVHAGVIGWGDSAIVLPGSTFTGKTTLVQTFLERGASYFSDEYAVLDAAGRVSPYPTPLSVRRTGAIRGEPVHAEAMGAVRATRPLPVGLVVLSEFKPGAVWRPRSLTPSKGALAMLAHTVAAREQAPLALQTLSRIASDTPVLKGSRGEAEETIERILRRFDREAA